ncbi:MAG: hypothetical protein ACLFU9_04115 [Candidatus Bathyarchaeia archaeon]
MPAKKLRMEVFDEEGNRYTIAIEGKITREKTLSLLDIVELLSGVHNSQESTAQLTNMSKFDKAKLIIKKSFSFTWFSSRDILLAYEKEFNEAISLSTVSTYLARMENRGFLTKRGRGNNRTYRMITKLAQNVYEL